MTVWNAASLVYGLCLLASILCAALLMRTYYRSRTRLLLWSACSFALLALNNFLLVADLIFLPDTDLSLPRQITALASVSVLLIGFIWEVE